MYGSEFPNIKFVIKTPISIIKDIVVNFLNQGMTLFLHIFLLCMIYFLGKLGLKIKLIQV